MPPKRYSIGGEALKGKRQTESIVFGLFIYGTIIIIGLLFLSIIAIVVAVTAITMVIIIVVKIIMGYKSKNLNSKKVFEGISEDKTNFRNKIKELISFPFSDNDSETLPVASVVYGNDANICPLSDEQVEKIIDILESKRSDYDFDAYDFIDKCLIGEKNCKVVINAGNRIPCGKRLGRYRSETCKIIDSSAKSGQRGRKWKKQNSSLIHHQSTLKVVKKIPPITVGHQHAIIWYTTPFFSQIKEAYDTSFGYNNVYFRVTDKGVTAISLDLDCPSFLGINPKRDSEKCYIHSFSSAKPIQFYTELKKDFDNYKKTIKRISIEEKTVIKYMKYLFHNNLALMNLPSGCYFLNNEWRFLDFEQGGKKSDVHGININSGSLIIIEFKSEATKRREAIKQVKHYSDLYLNEKSIYDDFFYSQFCALSSLYLGDDKLCQGFRFLSKPELYFGYPDNNNIVIEKVF